MGSSEVSRFGVYGFRPSDSEDESEEGEMPVANLAQAVQQSGVGMLIGSAPAWATAPTAASNVNHGAGTQHNPAPRRAPPKKQFYCFVHNRLRSEDALVDDGDGHAVCRP